MLGHCMFYGDVLAKELELYPKELFKSIKLKQIVFVGDLKWRDQTRLAIPNVVSGVMYVDPFPMYTLNYMIRCFHHELLHMLDYKMMGGYAKSDPDWEELNPPGVTYGNGGKYNRDSNAFLMKVPHFINAYAQSATEEDKAETWSAMVVHPTSIIEHDERVIRKKGERIAHRVRTQICPQMDHRFWQRCKARHIARQVYERRVREPCARNR